MKIDESDGNTKWADAEQLEVAQLFEYQCFKDMGKGSAVPTGYKKIPCHFVYDVKHSGKYKAHFVAGGHRTDTPIDSVYSGVVSLCGIRTVAFLAELNDLELWGTDVGNSYLESWTKEKVSFSRNSKREIANLALQPFVLTRPSPSGFVKKSPPSCRQVVFFSKALHPNSLRAG